MLTNADTLATEAGDVTMTELLKLADVVAGTATANKAAILGANKDIDELRVETTFKLGSTTVGATAAEINNICDKSAGVQAITAAGAVTADGTKYRATLSGGAYAITLAAPGAGAVGQFLCIEYRGGDTDAVTLANTNLVGGSAGSTYTFNADGEAILLYALADKWLVVKEVGVTIA